MRQLHDVIGYLHSDHSVNQNVVRVGGASNGCASDAVGRASASSAPVVAPQRVPTASEARRGLQLGLRWLKTRPDVDPSMLRQLRGAISVTRRARLAQKSTKH